MLKQSFWGPACYFLLSILISPAALAQVVPDMVPKRCTGFIEESDSWSGVILKDEASRYCPANHAVYGTSKMTGSRLNYRGIIVPIHCCPLPSDNILVEEKVYVEGECPKDSVVTGVKHRGLCSRVPIISLAVCSEDQGYLLQCTKINTEKYTLSDPAPGVFWGFASSEYAEDKVIFKKTIPEPIRDAIGRKGKYSWNTAGCIGAPPGSLLTARKGKRCKHLEFKRLMHKSNDRLAGPLESPVQMYPR